ncbi:MAG: translation elongation factor 4 [Patescibacteria group bacterium]|nr:translation elongation factor 4 [Patescibacteria group bacterium]
MNQSEIRNFCIIAHIDHGKSTLADRFLELTGTVEKRKLKEQTLDTMDLERERGITIKLQPVRMEWKGHILNLIDTPGHVDFTYEVSRSLAACEGAILLVDATQGIQAQTLANYNLAREQNLKIVPVVNKIDLVNAETEKVRQDLAGLLRISTEEILLASGKTGEGVADILDKVINIVPAPSGNPQLTLRALIFDSFYNTYQGVVAMVRIVDGEITHEAKIKIIGTETQAEALEIGYFIPGRKKTEKLQAGEVGYIATGLKEVARCRVGDTITELVSMNQELGITPLPGYKEITPMVFSQIFCVDSNEYNKLKAALGKLKLNDASLSYEPVSSQALGFGFRCGFLGLLHMDIIRERLEREYNVNLVLTAPTVNYKIYPRSGEMTFLNNPAELPPLSEIDYIEEPYVAMDIITPVQYLGQVMELVQKRKGEYLNQQYLTSGITVLTYKIPLVKIILDFYDNLKSVSSGYASLSYKLAGYQKTEIILLDFLIAGDKIDALSMLVYPDEAFGIGRAMTGRLKKIIPRQMFEVAIQAAIGGKIIARETLGAFRKDVTAKLYGGDRTRKDKLLEKQKKGKKKMKKIGRIELPSEAFLAILKRE